MNHLLWAFIASAGLLVLNSSQAGSLEDSLLASAAGRLDVKGAEIALRRGAKANEPLPHPDAPEVRRTPIQMVLRSLIGAEDADAGQRAERLLRMLFKSGAKLSGDPEDLFAPITYGNERIVNLLLDQGANPHARIYGYTTAELSIKYGQLKLLPIFYARGVSKVDAETMTQIQLVAAAGIQRLDEMKSAVLRGAKVDSPDPAGRFAIVQLFSAPLINPIGYDAVKWILLEADANPGVVDLSEERSTALHKLIQRNSYKRGDHFTTAAIAEMLLQRGAEVSEVDSMKRTPLHYAAREGNVLAMKVLIRRGAKISARDAAGSSPLDLARSGEAISLLRESGARE